MSVRKGGKYMISQLMDVVESWQKILTNAIEKLLIPILIIGCSVGMIWAIVIGIKMMKAEDKNAREENKQRLINIAISIVAVAVLIGLFYALQQWLGDANNQQDLKDSIFDTSSTHIGGTLANTLSLAKQCISMIL